MNSKRNYLDADNDLMEKNLRFVNNDLEKNLNQYFTGAGTNDENCNVPSREYQVIQPKPEEDSLFKQRQFLVQLGMSFNEATALAKILQIDILYYEQRRNNLLNNGMLESDINMRLIQYFRQLGERNHDEQKKNNINNSNKINNGEMSHNMPPPPAPRMLNWDSNKQFSCKTTDYKEVESVSSTLYGRGLLSIANKKGISKNPQSSKYVKKKMAIVAKEYPKQVLSPKHSDKIQSALRKRLSSVKKPPIEKTSFKCITKAGYISVLCESSLFHKWLKSSMRQIKFNDIKLKLIPEESIPSEAIYYTYFPNSANMKTKKILAIVQHQNEELKIDTWRCLQNFSDGNSAKLTLCIDPISTEILEKNNWCIAYNFDQVQLIPTRKTRSKKSKQQNRSSNNSDV